MTSYGIGLNVKTDLSWFDRIVACGLVGKRATSIEKEGVAGIEVDEVAGVFARSVAAHLLVPVTRLGMSDDSCGDDEEMRV